MAGETTITVVGNLTADPELRFTQSGAAVASFTVASTPRTFDKQSGELDRKKRYAVLREFEKRALDQAQRLAGAIIRLFGE